MRTSWTAVAVGLALLAGLPAGAARAGEIPEPQPVPGLVLPPADGLAAIVASFRGERVCVQGSLTEPFDEDARCGDPLLRDDEAAVAVTLEGDAGGRDTVVGVVPAGAARVRVAFPGGERVEVPTVPSPASLAPQGDRLAFFRVGVPAAGRPPGEAGDEPLMPAWVQALDATGAVIGVRGGLDTGTGSGGSRVGPTRTRVVARRGGTSTRVTSYVQEVLAPTAARLDRVVAQACFGLSARRSGGLGGTDGGENCTDAAELVPLGPQAATVLPGDLCGSGASVGAQGVLPAGTTAARAILGSGRRVPVGLIDLAPALPGRVGVAYVPPAGEAVRRLELDGPVTGVPLEIGPAAVTCAGRDGNDLGGSFGFGFLLASSAQVTPVALAGPPAALLGSGPTGLVGAEGPEGTLCLAVGRTTLGAADCGELARAPGAALAATSPATDAGSTVAGVVGRSATAVTVVLTRLSGGRFVERRVDAPTTPAPPDVGGAYAGRLRAFSVPARPGEHPSEVLALSPSGRALDDDDTDERSNDQPLVVGPSDGAAGARTGVRRLGRVGALVAWSRVSRFDGRTLRCAVLTTGPRPTDADPLDCGPLPSVTQVTVAASCGPRRLALSAVLDRRGARLRLTGRDGRAMTVRRFALGAGQTFQVAVPASGRGVRRVALTGAHGVAVPIAPARAQCGYTTSVTVPARRAVRD